ncbi:hypothetical protein D3C81_1229890 [compost metagenome]
MLVHHLEPVAEAVVPQIAAQSDLERLVHADMDSLRPKRRRSRPNRLLQEFVRRWRTRQHNVGMVPKRLGIKPFQRVK